MGRPLLRWLPAIVIAATVLYTISVYPTLPARIPSHFGINGRPSGSSSREFGAWILPGVMVFLWIVFRVVPKIDPKKANYEKFGTVYDLVIAAILLFQAIVQYMVLSVAQGRAVDINTVIYVGLGALFVILGVAMPHTKPTWFFGIRTPWTLSDDTVWTRTHRTGGLLLVASGALTIFAALTAPPPVAFAVMLASSMVATLGSVLVSYLYWRQR